MDANCQWATPGAASEICGFAGIAWSPISLIWEDDASLDDGMTVVSFSIDARQPDAFSLWKASEKTPLLVYDPTHSTRLPQPGSFSAHILSAARQPKSRITDRRP